MQCAKTPLHIKTQAIATNPSLSVFEWGSVYKEVALKYLRGKNRELLFVLHPFIYILDFLQRPALLLLGN